MSIAVSNTQGFPLPPVTALQTARALRRLRWRLTRNTIASLLSGSRLRLSMISVLQPRLLDGPLRALPRGLRIHRPFRRAVPCDLRIPVQHVLPVDLDHAFLLDRDHHLYGPLSFARGGLSADDARHDRPDLRLQVRRVSGDLELGFLSAGKPADGGLRADDQSTGRLLRRCS